MVDTSGEDDVAIEPPLTWGDLRKGHAHLKGDPGLLGQNSHRANQPNGRNHLPEQSPNRGWLTSKVMGERVAATGVRLVAIGERTSASLATPQA